MKRPTMEQKLEYINQGRIGYVVYKDRQGDIRLPFEFGGGNCVAIISVPTVAEWTSKTNRPVANRQAILQFVAEQSIKDQAPNSYYELNDNCIEIFENALTLAPHAKKNGKINVDNDTQTYDFSDAWFLTALIVMKDYWANMKEIISVGDALNHAIFTQNEINQALKRFIPIGYIETNGKKYRATEKAYELTNCVAYKRAGMFTQVEVILKRLNTKRNKQS